MLPFLPPAESCIRALIGLESKSEFLPQILSQIIKSKSDCRTPRRRRTIAFFHRISCPAEVSRIPLSIHRKNGRPQSGGTGALIGVRQITHDLQPDSGSGGRGHGEANSFDVFARLYQTRFSRDISGACLACPSDNAKAPPSVTRAALPFLLLAFKSLK